jgi:quercetin 2,3-dioxygenase
MSTVKSIQQVLAPPAAHMVGDGFRVHNFFPSGYNMGLKRMSPFVMLDYNSKVEFPPTDTPRGVGVHPHRGFETVTIAYHGKVAHHDSAGNSGIIGEGDVQWMTAASGVLHKEYHEKEFSKAGGMFQMVQLWVNLPAKDKMSTPKYQELVNEKMGKFISENKDVLADVIAGELHGVKGAASTFTPINMYNISMKAESNFEFNLPSNFNTGILVIEGSVVVNGTTKAAADHFILFKNDGEIIELTATENTKLLVLSGQPIDEPIVPYGPFVMNTKEEIMQAYNDFNTGKFGVLED